MGHAECQWVPCWGPGESALLATNSWQYTCLGMSAPCPAAVHSFFIGLYYDICTAQ